MDKNTKVVLDFIKKMHLTRQRKLFQLKTIKLEKQELQREEDICKQGIKNIEAKIKSEVLANPELKAKFSIQSNDAEVDDEEVDEEEEK